MKKILAADIGGTKTKLALCSLNGQIEGYQQYDTDSHKGGPAVIQKLIERLKTYEGYDAIAISTAGQVDANQGTIIYANENIPDYTGMPIKDILELEFAVPVRVENDVNAAALGEAYFGAGQWSSHFLCLTYGTGIGGAIVMNNSIYRGSSGSAGEFGHMITNTRHQANGHQQAIFYEHVASTTALVSLAQQVNTNWNNGIVICEGWEQGNEALQAVIEQWSNEVAIGLASLIHIFNPPLIILGGGIMERASILSLIEQKTRQMIMSSFAHVQIKGATLGNTAGLLGAASLYIAAD